MLPHPGEIHEAQINYLYIFFLDQLKNLFRSHIILLIVNSVHSTAAKSVNRFPWGLQPPRSSFANNINPDCYGNVSAGLNHD